MMADITANEYLEYGKSKNHQFNPYPIKILARALWV